MRYPIELTYWSTTNNGLGGYTYGNPTSIYGRWVDIQEQFLNAAGQLVFSSSIIYVDTAVAVKGFLYKGRSFATDPTTVAGAVEIRKIQEASNLSGYKTVRKVFI